MKLNLGSADIRKDGYINIDISPDVKPDLVADATDLSKHFKSGSVDEIYCGHLLEHLYPEEADKAMKHWFELLKPGGELVVVVPDFRFICKAYLEGSVSLKETNDLFIYSYAQPSHHRYMYDQESLFQLFDKHGFKNIKAIDRLNDPRLAYGVEWQCGCVGARGQVDLLYQNGIDMGVVNLAVDSQGEVYSGKEVNNK